MTSFDEDLKKLRNLKIALVYDRVNTKHGGAEQVLKSLHELFPNAPLYTSVYDEKQATWAKEFTVIPSFLQHIPFVKTHHREFLPLMPLAFSSFDLSAFDIVISITSAEAKGIQTSTRTLHICYLLTPTRYLWSHHLEYEIGKLRWMKKLIFNIFRYWDFWAGQNPNLIIPISELVRQRTQKYYQRKTTAPIYPPFLKFKTRKEELPDDIQEFLTTHPKFLLIISRLVTYKNVNLAIKVCQNTNTPLVIVGSGPEKKRITKLIGQDSTIKLLPKLSESQLIQVLGSSSGLLLLAEEDFGIVALEAQSHGKPVIVNQHSGAAETVIDGKTGIHVNVNNTQQIHDAIHLTMKKAWDTVVIKKNADKYNNLAFQKKFVEKVWMMWKNKEGQ